MRHVAYLALGSNLGDRLAFLRAAVAALGGQGVVVRAASPVFETDAVAHEPQPAYLNAALRVDTALLPRELLEHGLGVERALGRVRPLGLSKAPRTIDIDLLLYDDLCLDEPGLCVPHPALLERAFVRIPLAAVAAPGLRHPRGGDRLDVATADAAVRELVGARII